MALKHPERWEQRLLTSLQPILPLLEDESITEIEVNGFNHIRTKGHRWRGHRVMEGIRWPSRESLLTACTRISEVTGRIVNDKRPLYDGRLPDGSRINIVVAPSCELVSITIRKFPAETMSLEKLLGFGALNTEVIEILHSLILARKNILVSGGTNSGKTSLLNALSRLIPEEERIVTVEDSRELQIKQANWVALETVQAFKEGMVDVPIRALVKNTLRMTPDRIVVGECRGDEALDLLRAFSTGHSGGLSTVHANSAADALDQVQLLAQFGVSGGVSGATVAQLVARAIDIVIQVKQFEEDDSRKVAEIIEVERPYGVRIQDGAAQYQFRSLIRYEVTGVERNGEDPRIVGRWVHPESPSGPLQATLQFKGLPWPEASLHAHEEAACLT